MKDGRLGSNWPKTALLNKKSHGLKAQPLKDFILGSSPSVNRKLLRNILTNVNIHPPTQNF